MLVGQRSGAPGQQVEGGGGGWQAAGVLFGEWLQACCLGSGCRRVIGGVAARLCCWGSGCRCVVGGVAAGVLLGGWLQACVVGGVAAGVCCWGRCYRHVVGGVAAGVLLGEWLQTCVVGGVAAGVLLGERLQACCWGSGCRRGLLAFAPPTHLTSFWPSLSAPPPCRPQAAFCQGRHPGHGGAAPHGPACQLEWGA